MKPVRTLRLLMLFNLVMIYLGMREYGDLFQFWAYPLSSLGGTVTMLGHANAAARRIFDIEMGVSSIIMLFHGLQMRLLASYPGAIASADLSFAAAVGFALAVSPHNLPVWGVIHAVGAGTFVASLWVIGLIHLSYLKSGLRRWYRRLLMTLQTGPLLVYAALYTLDDPLNYGVQKIALGGLALVLLRCEAEVNRALVLRRQGVVLGLQARPTGNTP